LHTQRFGLFVFSAGFYDFELMMDMAEIPFFNDTEGTA